MSSITSERRISEIMIYLEEHGIPETLKHYRIKKSTLERYKRSARYSSTKLPKILLLDVETAPMVVFTWGIFKPFLTTNNIITDWYCISWAAKWLFGSEMMSDVVTPEESLRQDDKRIMTSIWKLVQDADIIIGHNLKKFDNKKLKTRFILNSLPPPSPYQMIDTLEVSKGFSFSSNKLNYISKLIDNKEKLATDYSLWKRCYYGDPESLKYMLKYNEEDVFLLEDTYLFFRPWIKSHPNVGLIMESGEETCPACGSFNLKEEGYYYTMTGQYESLRCKNCTATTRRRTTVVDKDSRKNLLVSNAR